MSQTVRSLSAVLANLPDNTTQLISAEDIRDGIITVAPDYGTIYVVATAPTVITNTTAFFDVEGTYALAASSGQWDMNTNGQLRYVGEASRVALLNGTASFTTASNSQVISFVISKNGTPILSSEVQRKSGNAADVGAVAFFGYATVNQDDYFTVAVKNNTSATNITSVKAKIGAVGFAV
jgi:hypothetical protein